MLFVVAAWPPVLPGVAAVVGTWEGESLCAVPNSPCHDEHALYRIAAGKKNPAQLNIDGYKIVNGSPQFMGALLCLYRTEQAQLTCTGNTSKQDDWQFRVSGDSMTGTLTLGAEKMLYRRITLHKTSPKAH